MINQPHPRGIQWQDVPIGDGKARRVGLFWASTHGYMSSKGFWHTVVLNAYVMISKQLTHIGYVEAESNFEERRLTITVKDLNKNELASYATTASPLSDTKAALLFVTNLSFKYLGNHCNELIAQPALSYTKKALV